MAATASGDLLVAQGISLRFGDFVALDDVGIRFARGAITGIVGPNGAGKSTLFNVLGGQARPKRGRVVFDGRDVHRLPPHRRARLGLTRTFQLSRELGALTVLENLLLADRRQPGETLFGALARPRAVRRAQRAAIERARSLLDRVGLWPLADAPAATLSGGQKKLLELCRALMLEPRLVLLDEPAAGVDPVRIGEVREFIRALQRDGISFGIVEHDMDLIAALCDPVYVLAEGRVLTQGSFERIAADEAVVRAYLGGV